MKRENGYTGVDIAISVVVITIFIALIGTLVFNFNSSSGEMEYRSKAVDYAINEIEKLKIKNIDDEEIVDTDETEILENGNGTGYYKKIQVTDASTLEDSENSPIIENIAKKITVTVSYNFRNETKSVELSTIVSRDF